MRQCVDFDIETYSEAGYVYDPRLKKWRSPMMASNAKKGLELVGSAAYAEHPTTDILCMAYTDADGVVRDWLPGQPFPEFLDHHIRAGNLMRAWNAAFDWEIWNRVGVKKHGFTPIPLLQIRDAQDQSCAYSLPAALGKAASALGTSVQKNKEGTRLISLFCKPRNHTLKDSRHRTTLAESPADALSFVEYNRDDVRTQMHVLSVIPSIQTCDEAFASTHFLINVRGVQVDTRLIDICISFIEQTLKDNTDQIAVITGGAIKTPHQVGAIMAFANTLLPPHKQMTSLKKQACAVVLEDESTPKLVAQVLHIRQAAALVSVKKAYSMKYRATQEGRLHGLFKYHSARTGRSAGAGPQPQNLPRLGPKLWKCDGCAGLYGVGILDRCPHCGHQSASILDWGTESVDYCLEFLGRKDVYLTKYIFGEILPLVSGLLRGLFIAKDGCDLICSDFSAIEAVVLAQLAGEEWRCEVFRTHGKIYEMSASLITGIPFDEYAAYKLKHGKHHPTRGTIGKVAELASGFGGWVGAWSNFGADKFFSEDEMKKAIIAWRDASPKIVEFWGGQFKFGTPCLFGIEGMAISSVISPGKPRAYRGIEFLFDIEKDVMTCKLLSGRELVYHSPRLRSHPTRKGLELSFMGWNGDGTKGPIGWSRIVTYNGKLTENIVQATGRDILAFAIVNLERAGYPVVLHVHDEIVAEVSKNFGSIEDFERIMSLSPPWCKDWPIRASGGWRGKRYRK